MTCRNDDPSGPEVFSEAERPPDTATVRGGARSFLSRIGLGILIPVLAAGCVSQAHRARRAAAELTHVRSLPMTQLRSQRRLLSTGVHSEPYLADTYFPIGLYDVPVGALGEVAGAGFNTVVNADKDDPAYLARCAELGIRIIPYVNLERLGRDVKGAGANAVIWAWYLFDEPDLNKRSPGFIEKSFRALRKADPARPIFLTVWSPRRYADFMEFCDVFAPNPYPIVSANALENQLRRVGYALDRARRRARGQWIWAIIQAFWAKPWWQRNPTPAELRAMVYLALNHGAEGIIYFSYKSGDRPLTGHTELFDAIRRVNEELASLKPVLLAGRRGHAVTAELVSDDRGGIVIGRPQLAPLDVALWTLGERKVLVAVNPDPWGKQVKVVLPEAGPCSMLMKGRFLDAAGPMVIEGASPLLRFKPFEVRVFDVE